MKAKLIIDGKEINVNISDEILKMIKPFKKTGYERCKPGEKYYLCTDGMSQACDFEESGDSIDDGRYERGIYYSDPTVAENNARADKLMRQLRRFAVEHREDNFNWRDSSTRKYCIRYNHELQKLFHDHWHYLQDFNAIHFESEDMVKLAIKTFHDELIWYFTEYKDSL